MAQPPLLREGGDSAGPNATTKTKPSFRPHARNGQPACVPARRGTAFGTGLIPNCRLNQFLRTIEGSTPAARRAGSAAAANAAATSTQKEATTVSGGVMTPGNVFAS